MSWQMSYKRFGSVNQITVDDTFPPEFIACVFANSPVGNDVNELHYMYVNTYRKTTVNAGNVLFFQRTNVRLGLLNIFLFRNNT